MRGDGDVAGEGSVIGAPKFHSWDKCTMPSTQIGCPTLPLACELYCIILILYYIYIILRGSFISHLGV